MKHILSKNCWCKPEVEDYRGIVRQYTELECWILNIIDFRYWFCECNYKAPYGKVISADCKKHD